MKHERSGGWFYVNGHEAMTEVTGYVLMGQRGWGEAPSWSMQVTGRAGSAVELARAEVEASIDLSVLLLPSLMLVTIDFPNEASAEGVEHAHAAEFWIGRAFDVADDGTVVALFEGPVQPVVTRSVVVRRCQLPHPECAAA